MNIDQAFEYCGKITRDHYENFPVASLLIPKKIRPYVYSIYAFARTADDFADEPEYEGRRLEELDRWGKMLEECESGTPTHPIFIALQHTHRKSQIPIQLFRDLLTAFRMDVTVKRYENFERVLFYCKHSANPVGRLILHLFGYHDPELHKLSDYICTALQLANFWQDVSVDLKKDRIYIPQDEMKQFGYTTEQLFKKEINRSFKELLKYQVDRTQHLFDLGLPLCFSVKRPLSLELKVTWLGGTAILRKIEALEYEVLHERPKINKLDKVRLLFNAFTIKRPHNQISVPAEG